MDNFDIFALKYLNDWAQWDELFIKRITSANKKTQLSGIHDAAKYYKITRNFPKNGEKERFNGVRNKLDNVKGIVTKNNADKKVIDLSNSLKSIYGKNVISASSKLLWLKYKAPIVIYDKRALDWLKNKGYKIKLGDYATFRVAWLTEYNKKRKDIKDACSKLSSVKQYSHSYKDTKTEVSKLTSNEWFYERVFDKYVWFYADTANK